MSTRHLLRAPVLAAMVGALAALGCNADRARATIEAPPTPPIQPAPGPSFHSVARRPPPLITTDPARVRPTQPENVTITDRSADLSR